MHSQSIQIYLKVAFQLNYVHVHQLVKKFKFALISETVRDRVKQSEFPTLAGLLHAKLQILKLAPLAGF